MTTLESKTDSAAETGKNLHAWLLKIILPCSKKYTMTYYCRFQCGNCVIMPTDHECSCCCEVERVVMKKEESASEMNLITDHCQAFSCTPDCC